MGEKSFDAGEVIYEAGQSGDVAYIIRSGTVEISMNLGGKEVRVEAEAGDIIGDGAAIFTGSDGGPVGYRATATAIETVTAAELPLGLLRAQLATAPPLLRGWIISFVNRALKVIGQVAD